MRIGSTSLLTFQRNGYSVQCEHVRALARLRIYPFELVMAVGRVVIARHCRSFERHRVHHEWQHYIALVQRKPGALRDGAPFHTMAQPLR